MFSKLSLKINRGALCERRGALSLSIRGQKQFPVPFNIVLRTCKIYKENEPLKVNADTLEKQIKEILLS